MRRKKGDTAANPIPVYFVSSADGKTPVNGPANVAITLRKNGGIQEAAVSSVVLGGGGGWHWWTPQADDLDTFGEVAAVAAADGCDPFPFVFTVAPTNDAGEWAKLMLVGVGGLVAASLTPNGTGEIFAGADYHNDALSPIDLRVTGKPDMLGRTLKLGFGVDPLGRNTIVVVEGGVVASGVAGDQVVRFQPRYTDTEKLAPYIGQTVTAIAQCDFLLGAGPTVLHTPVAAAEYLVRSKFIVD